MDMPEVRQALDQRLPEVRKELAETHLSPGDESRRSSRVRTPEYAASSSLW